MHAWGDKDVDWKGINDAAEYIGTNLRRWGRVNVTQWKEKYGTVRVYCSFGWYQLFSITHPGYVYSRYPKWLWSLDCAVLSRFVTKLNFLVIPLQVRLYKHLYKKALEKWPHLRLEILSGADHSELLKEHGVHHIRTSKNGYEIRYDWHPDNFKFPNEDGEP